MNRIKKHQASRIEAYIAAIQYKLDQLLKAVQDGKKKHMHLTIRTWDTANRNPAYLFRAISLVIQSHCSQARTKSCGQNH